MQAFSNEKMQNFLRCVNGVCRCDMTCGERPQYAVVINLASASSPRQRRASIPLAIALTMRYNGICDQWHARRATMTEEANYGQISQSR